MDALILYPFPPHPPQGSQFRHKQPPRLVIDSLLSTLCHDLSTSAYAAAAARLPPTATNRDPQTYWIYWATTRMANF